MSDLPRSPRVIGLLGGIGSGKSRVAGILAERGAALVSGDEAGHKALRQPELKAQVVQRWGTGILDEQGEVIRRKLGSIVFRDAGERHALECIVHPWIKRRLRDELARLKEAAVVPLIVLDAAILLEAGWDDLCDGLVFVDVPRPLRLERIARWRGWSEKEVESREAAQLPIEEKARRAQYRLDNTGTMEELRVQVNALWSRWGLVHRTPNMDPTRKVDGT